MAEICKLPFLDTKFSLSDLQNLEKKGFFRSIFIELLKADKVKNIIPNELQINQTKEELYLKYNIQQIKNKKNNEFLIHNLNKEIYKLASLKKLSLDKFSSKAKKIFEIRKEYSYDRYFYSLLRNKNKSQIYEFYYQIESKESSINDLSKEHSSGSEKTKLGIIGPVNLINLNSEIAEILKISKDSIINDPIEIGNEWYLIQRENFVPAIYSEYYENQICMELLEKEIEKEYEKEYLNLMKNKLNL
ncbi:hypothetical protein [Prochlorococcus marinus]|uniref:PpiC domain-containing protein n=1 Tax=Prochlorococcus marinus (strain AS9601) TaxID=146891 RepID=A2BSF2_PROMS|nr:hypothetical protein [Prochlorococcus marinus]ABM70713.1 Hypothetical protein A9601_14301 [Prochlorococcus marinus str. AS9601]